MFFNFCFEIQNFIVLVVYLFFHVEHLVLILLDYAKVVFGLDAVSFQVKLEFDAFLDVELLVSLGLGEHDFQGFEVRFLFEK